jgi:hypothetical protein
MIAVIRSRVAENALCSWEGRSTRRIRLDNVGSVLWEDAAIAAILHVPASLFLTRESPG